jgi:hypothetical protein
MPILDILKSGKSRTHITNCPTRFTGIMAGVGQKGLGIITGRVLTPPGGHTGLTRYATRIVQMLQTSSFHS